MAVKIALTDREADVMQILWERGSASVAEVQNYLHDELAYNTVLTVLRTLETKKFVHHQEEGRGHRYFPSVKQHNARKSALKHLTDKLFGGSPELLLTHLVSDEKLSAQQIRRMRDLLAANSNNDKR